MRKAGREPSVHAEVAREPQNLEAGIAPVNVEQLLPRLVDRPVLDDDDLEVVFRVGLEDALEPARQLVDAVLLVVRRNDDGNELLRTAHHTFHGASPESHISFSITDSR